MKAPEQLMSYHYAGCISGGNFVKCGQKVLLPHNAVQKKQLKVVLPLNVIMNVFRDMNGRESCM